VQVELALSQYLLYILKRAPLSLLACAAVHNAQAMAASRPATALESPRYLRLDFASPVVGGAAMIKSWRSWQPQVNPDNA
jgi:hypothetical protein